jgi:L-threonylcarbamoyladenylate synthase
LNKAVEALRDGQTVILPTDTVYGLFASAHGSVPTERLYALKGRDRLQPSALLVSDVDVLLDCVPELAGRAELIVRALLPGPFTLILPNPAHRFRWLTGDRPETIGVRVPDLPDITDRIVTEIGCVVATSANLPGGPEPRRLEEIDAALRDRVEAIVDGGELPGTPSTVLDLTGAEPRVVREGAASSADALDRVASALA